MDIGTHYRVLDKVDVSEIQKVLQEMPPEKWEINQHRQQQFQVHQHTDALVLRFHFDTNTSDYNDYRKDFPEFDFIKDILNHISSFYDKGGYIRMVFARMPAKSQVYEHMDIGKMFAHAHRIHIVIDTNEDVSFTVTDPDGVAKEIPFSDGAVIEINNRWLHRVENNSNRDRIHLIVDYITDTSAAALRKL